MHRITPKHVTLLFFLGAVWSLFPIFTKMSTPVLGAGIVVFARCLVGVLCLMPIIYIKGFKYEFKKHLKFYLTISILNTALPLFLFAFASNYVSGAIMTIINGTTPLWNIPVAYFFLKKKIEKVALVGLFISFIGLFILVKNGLNYSDSSMSIVAMVMLLVASASYTFAALVAKQYRTSIEPSVLVCVSFIMTCIMYTPMVTFDFIALDKSLITAKVIFGVVMLGVICTGLTNFLYFKLIKETSVLFATSTTFLMPIFGTIFSIMFLDEVYNIWDGLFIAVVIFGVILISRGEAKAARKEP